MTTRTASAPKKAKPAPARAVARTCTGRPRPIPPATIQRMVAVEYDFVAVDTDLGELMGRIHGLPVPGVLDALAELDAIRGRLLRVLDKLDEPITRMVRAWEEATGRDAVAEADPEAGGDPDRDTDDLPF